MCDFHPRRRDEVPENARRRILLGRAQRLERALEMVLDDVLRSAQAPERLESHEGRAALALNFPYALHHELEVGRLDPAHCRFVLRRLRAPSPARLDAARGDLVEHGLDEL